MDRGLRQANRRAVAMITTLGRLRGVATVVFSGFLGVGGITSVIRTLSQFETAMSSVSALVSAQNPRSLTATMNVLTERAREMGATTLFTATQAAEGMKFLTLAGFEANEVFQAIEPSLNLAAAGMLDLGTAADIVSNIMAAFNVEAAETEMVADALAFTSARTNTNIQQLGEAMKFVGPVAGTLGVNVQETAVALGILGNSGLQASLAGTSLRRVMSGLLNPSREADQVLSSMNLTSEQLVDVLQGGGETGQGLVDLIKLLADRGISAADAFTLFGQRGAPGLLSLVTQKDDLAALTAELDNVAGTAKRMAEILADNLGGDGRIALSALQESILRLGDSGLYEWLRGVTQGFTGFIRTLSGIPIEMGYAYENMMKGAKAAEFLMRHANKLKLAIEGLAVILTTKLIVALVRSFALMGHNAVASIGRFIASMIAASSATTALTFSLGLLKAAIITTGVGALLVGAGYLLEWALGSKEAEDATKNLSEEIDQLGIAAEEALVRFDAFQGVARQNQFDKQRMNVLEAAQAVTTLKENIQAVIDANANLAQSEAAAVAQREKSLEIIHALGEADLRYGERLDLQRDQRIKIREAEAELNQQRELSSTNLGELQAQLEKAEATYQQQIDALQVMALVNAGYAKTTEEARKKIEDLAKAKEDLNEQTKRLTGFTQDELDTFGKLIKKYDALAISIKELEAEQDELNKLSKASDAALAALGTTAEGVARAQANLAFELAKTRQQLTPLEQEAKDYAEKLQDLRDGTDKAAQIQTTLQRNIADVNAAYVRGSITLEQYIEFVKLYYEVSKKELAELCDHNKKARECTEDSAKRIQQIWEQAMRGIQDAFADFFRSGLDGFDDFADQLLDAFKDMIAEMLAAWFSSGLMNLFQGQGFNAGGNSFPFSNLGGIFGGGSGASGGGGGTGGGFMSSLTGMWDGAKNFFNQAAFYLGEFAGGFSGFFSGTSASTFASGVGGSAPNWAAAGGSAVAAAGTGFVTGFAVDKIVGSRGDPTLTTALSAVGGVIGSIIPGLGTVLGAAIGGAVGAFVGNLIGGAKKLERATLQFSGSVDGVSANLETITSKQRSFFRGRKFTTKNEALDVSSVNEVISMIADTIRTVAEGLGVSSDAINDFRIDRDIDLTGKSEAYIERALENLFSDTILGLIGTFVDNTEGLTDRLHKTIQAYRGDADQFLAAFQMAAAIDMTLPLNAAQAIQDQIVEQNKTMTETYRALVDGYRELVTSYDGSLESLSALSQATVVLKEVQLQLAAALISAGEEISRTFQDSAQSIREQLMSEEELYALRRSQIDELVDQATTTTDPEQLKALADRINTLANEAWGLLDESQQAGLGSEFIGFFEEVEGLFGDRIQEGLDMISEDTSALDQEVATAMTEAAQSIIDANNAARDLWEEWRQELVEGRYRRPSNPLVREIVP